MRNDLPSGTVTFLFTDVEGSTRLLHELGEEGYAEALAEHRRLIRQACVAEGGVEVDTQGDAFFFAFPTVPGAIAAASALSSALASGDVQVRVGVHTGEPLLTEEGYVGEDVHFAARVAAAGHGGQILVSAQTAARVAPSDTVSLGGSLLELGEHRLKDIGEPVALFQLGEGDFPPLKTIANTNLPTPVSTFLGREAELYEADELLRGARLLTVTGPGGAGKTRFALELARRAREERFSDYPAGVFSCFLSSLRDPSLVLPTVAQTLSASEQPGQSALEALSAHLEGKRMLLLLDNLEHLLAAAPELSQLLERCAGLTVLVTSREVLRVRGEATYALPPLAEDEGVALFCERARVEPSEPVRELCLRLEGLPLAIELAAARLAVLTPVQLLERLSQRLDLLKAGRDADPRQQTLRATIEWSYDLLTEEEQRLFARLSVFAGGCTLQTAEPVVGADVDTLQSLVDKSLLRFTDGRYWMLETIREYACQQLDADENADAVRSRYAQFFARSLAEPPLLLDRASWTHALEAERANLRSALVGALEYENAETRLQLASTYGWLCMVSGPAHDGLSLLMAALEGAPEMTVARARALWGLGALAWRVGERELCRRCHDECVQIARDAGDLRLLGRSLRALGILAAEDRDEVESTSLLREALSLFRELGDRAEVDECLAMLGYGATIRGDLDVARAFLEEALVSARGVGNQRGVMRCAGNLAIVARHEDRLEEALELIREALVVAHELADLGSLGGFLAELAFMAPGAGNARDAAVLLGGAEALYEATDLSFDADELERRGSLLAWLSQELSPEGMAQLDRAGRAMTVDRLVEHALAVVEAELDRESASR